MPDSSIREFIPILQTSIGPVILISGIGLLLLTMTNRLGRIIDRSRALLAGLDSSVERSADTLNRELDILWKRARFIRMAILLSTLTCLGASVMIMLLFYSVLANIDTTILIAVLFFFCMASLSVSLVYFIFDVNLTLTALKIEQEIHPKLR
ncbi:MAG: hypothetical protein A3K90_03250 [Pelodictyon luteolum]|jgi:hypothetical protein|uniref:DUF2721 domain-containing protein n=2 Tax=Pelodictyon luteolum TaxID=1100 RepID=Q3B5A9_CHLL3|nr:DUF2721 domain-containing protein [Pelodictyon luteolum]ABB23472.1 conserved hypothetical protein [Pelodictyon luteolum DSM 273]KZK73827.1 MAG: hypothetical protein A3K90_03250 [Pelodictyon luteolum]